MFGRKRAKISYAFLFFQKRGVTVNLQDQKIKELSVEEYFYLTENLENTDSRNVENGVKYLVYNKRKKLIDIVRKVMECELTDFERALALDHWSNGMTLREIAEKYRVNCSSVYRNLHSIKEKLETYLKYVLLYDKTSLPETAEELLKYVRYTEN